MGNCGQAKSRTHILGLAIYHGSTFIVSGVDTEQTPASIEWIVTASAYTPTANGGLAGNYAITNGNNCLPYLICAYSSHLEIGAGRMVNLIP